MDFKINLKIAIENCRKNSEHVWSLQQLLIKNSENILEFIEAVDEEIFTNGDEKEFPIINKARKNLSG